VQTRTGHRIAQLAPLRVVLHADRTPSILAGAAINALRRVSRGPVAEAWRRFAIDGGTQQERCNHGHAAFELTEIEVATGSRAVALRQRLDDAEARVQSSDIVVPGVRDGHGRVILGAVHEHQPAVTLQVHVHARPVSPWAVMTVP